MNIVTNLLPGFSKAPVASCWHLAKSARVIQYQVSCDEPHPDYGEQMLNFDLSKLAQLHDLTERFPKLDYYSLLKEKYSNNNELQAECEYFESRDNWERVKWRLTADGVMIQPYYGHSMAPCEVDFFLSTQELNDHS